MLFFISFCTKFYPTMIAYPAALSFKTRSTSIMRNVAITILLTNV